MDDAERDYFINNPKVAAKSKRAALYTPDEINKLASKRKECPICGHKVKEHSEKSSVFGTKVICDVCDCKTKQKDFFAILDRLYPTEDMINNCGACGHKKKDHYIRASSWRLTKIICNICRCKNDLLESRPACRNPKDLQRQVKELAKHMDNVLGQFSVGSSGEGDLKNRRFAVVWDGAKIITNPDGQKVDYICHDEMGEPFDADD
mgnify:FL=1